jgi:hypothetical protein
MDGQKDVRSRETKGEGSVRAENNQEADVTTMIKLRSWSRIHFDCDEVIQELAMQGT